MTLAILPLGEPLLEQKVSDRKMEKKINNSKATNVRQKCKGWYTENGQIRGVGSSSPCKVEVVEYRANAIFLPWNKSWIGTSLVADVKPVRSVAVVFETQSVEKTVFPTTTRIRNFL